jgi:two-component system, sensor histidine kinase LadS
MLRLAVLFSHGMVHLSKINTQLPCSQTSLRRFGLMALCACMLLVSVLLHLPAAAQETTAAQAEPTLPSLFESSKLLALPEPVLFLNASNTATLTPQALIQSPARDAFKPWKMDMPLATSATQHVWLRLVLPTTTAPESWMLRIPRPNLEQATLYAFNTGQNKWQQISAGRAVPNSTWPMRTRDPVFALSTRSDQTQLFFIQLQNANPITESIQLINARDFADGTNHAGTLNGLIIGIFGALTLISLTSAWLNRSSHFSWLAVFCFFFLITQLTLSGYMILRVWPQSTYLPLTMGKVLPLLSVAALARFAISVSYARDLSKPIYYGLWTLIALCIAYSILILVMVQSLPSIVLIVLIGAGVMGISISLVWIAWRSQHWLWWIVLSLIPLAVSVMARLAYDLGWVAHTELALLAGVITAALGLMLIHYALVAHQRHQISAAQAEQALETNDISTGLFTERIAKIRLPQIIVRSKRFERPCSAILLRWLDFESVMTKASSTDRGRILAHLGSRLARLAREIDTVARVGDDQFMFLVEAPVNREDVNSLASKILTTCLRPSIAMGSDKGFDLHIAVWLSSDVPSNATQVFELLNTRINQMRAGTQRRVQFVDTPLTTGSHSSKAPAEHAAELVAKINSLEATQELPTIQYRSFEPEPFNDKK